MGCRALSCLFFHKGSHWAGGIAVMTPKRQEMHQLLNTFLCNRRAVKSALGWVIREGGPSLRHSKQHYVTISRINLNYNFVSKVEMSRIKSTPLIPQIKLGQLPEPLVSAITTSFQFQLAQMRPSLPCLCGFSFWTDKVFSSISSKS